MAYNYVDYIQLHFFPHVRSVCVKTAEWIKLFFRINALSDASLWCEGIKGVCVPQK